MILAAGEGTRLRPLTENIPKAMLPIGGVPLVHRTIRWLAWYGIEEIVINLYYKGEKIRAYLGDGERLGVRINYSPEETLLGTAGGVKRAAHHFTGTFVVVYGDVLTNFDLNDMAWHHSANGALATLALTQATDTGGAGIVEIAKDYRITGFVEKPAPGTSKNGFVNGGIYIMEKDILKDIPTSSKMDFAYDIFPRLINENRPLYGYLLHPEDYLIDIGSFAKYEKANIDIARLKQETFYVA